MRNLFQGFSIDYSYRTCQIRLFLCSITDNYHLVKHEIIALQLNCSKNRPTTHCNFTFLIAYITN